MRHHLKTFQRGTDLGGVSGLQESIIYSYDLATIPSILPAFANSRDLIVCDEVR